MNEEAMILSSKRKWLIVGIILALVSPPFPGLIYGLALLSEKNYRKEGWIVIAVTVVWLIFTFFLLKWLVISGLLPRFQLVQ